MDSLSQFRDTYITECLELLTQMEDELLSLDETADKEKLNAIFRCAHSIKGGAGAFGFNEIGRFTHTLEAVLDKLRDGEITVSRELTDLLLIARDIVLTMVIAIRDNKQLAPGYGSEVEQKLRIFAQSESQTTVNPIGEGKPSIEQVKPDKISHFIIKFVPLPSLLATGNEPLLLLRELAQLGQAEVTCHTEKLPNIEEIAPDICYLSWTIALETMHSEADIRDVFEFVEDECQLEICLKQPDGYFYPQVTSATSELAEIKEEAFIKSAQTENSGAREVISSIRVDTYKVDRLINMVGEMVITQSMLAMRSRNLPIQEYADLIQGIEELTQHTRELQEAVMAVRMQPVKSLFSRMPRIIRDIATQLGKDIRLEMTGENTEVDKTIIEQLADPLTHMIRNAVDHGIEAPEARRAAGKPTQGTIRLSAEHRGGKIVITVADDGQGINREKVLKKAIEKEIINPTATPSNAEIDMLIFAAGFSTAEAITNISGRGVGMDVVKRNIENLGGAVAVNNFPSKGTEFIISLPLTLAILDGMVVKVASEQYIIPIANIIETLRPAAGEIKKLASNETVINVRGEFIPVIYLYEIFGIKEAMRDASKALVILIENGNSTIGLVVDELIGQQQVVIKSLEENANAVPGISGATILGDGRVSLIIDILGICQLKQQSFSNINHAA